MPGQWIEGHSPFILKSPKLRLRIEDRVDGAHILRR